MSTEENKAFVSRLLNTINQGNFDQFRELLSPSMVDHAVPAGVPPTRDGIVQYIQQIHNAFPDLHYTQEFSLAEGDRVCQYLTGTGTMKGELMGLKPTNKKATWTETHIARLSGGKIVEHWAVVDQAGILQQVGHMPKM